MKDGVIHSITEKKIFDNEIVDFSNLTAVPGFIALIPIQPHMTVMYEEIQEEPEAIRKTINENADKIKKVIDQIKNSSLVFIASLLSPDWLKIMLVIVPFIFLTIFSLYSDDVIATISLSKIFFSVILCITPSFTFR